MPAPLPLALMAAAAAAQTWPSPTVGLAGGAFVTGEDHPLNTAPTGVGRLGLQVSHRLDLEADIAGFGSTTRSRYGYTYTALDPRLNLLVHVSPDARADVFFAGGAGIVRTDVHRTSVEEQPDASGTALYRNPSTDVVVDLGPGLTLQVAGPVHLRTDLRLMGTFGSDATPKRADNYAPLEWTAGFDIRRELPPDTDGDGLVDKEDECPEEAEDFDDFRDTDGCPDWDNDGDRIDDESDECPDDAEDRDGYRDGDGCPDRDNDKDGLLDVEDGCPDEAEDKDGDRDGDGCPEADLDTDRDGILDVDDACADEPETQNGFDDEDGCPDDIPVEVARFTGVIEGITFETNSDRIRPSSEPTLEGALQVLFDYPTIRLEVAGHTDSQGNDAFNLDLSQRRSESVVRWFAEHGIDSARFIPAGYGESQPIDTNMTAAGRSVNRRVEFKLLSQ